MRLIPQNKCEWDVISKVQADVVSFHRTEAAECTSWESSRKASHLRLAERLAGMSARDFWEEMHNLRHRIGRLRGALRAYRRRMRRAKLA